MSDITNGFPSQLQYMGSGQFLYLERNGLQLVR